MEAPLDGIVLRYGMFYGPGTGFAAPMAPGSVHVDAAAKAAELAVTLGHADLLSNHTNDGWFDRSVATDLHAAQIRLRAPELGVPLLRATLSGKSGVFREDGRFELWGEPLSEGAYAVELRWQPVRTPARSAWLTPLLILGLSAGSILVAWKPTPRKP